MCWAVARNTLNQLSYLGLPVGIGGSWFPVKEDVSLVWSYSNPLTYPQEAYLSPM